MASTEGSTLKYTSESAGASFSTSMHAAFEGKDIDEKITPGSPMVQSIENRLVIDPDDPLTKHAEEKKKPDEDIAAPKPLKIDLKNINFQLSDEQLDEKSLLPELDWVEAKHDITKPALSQDLSLPPMQAAILKPFLNDRKERHLELEVPERPTRDHHTPLASHSLHELVEPRPERIESTPKQSSIMPRFFRRTESKEARLQAREERRAERRARVHAPLHASDIHEELGVGRLVHDYERPMPQPVPEVEVQTVQEVTSIAERRLGSLSFLRKLKTNPAVVNDAKALEYIDQLFEDETAICKKEGIDEDLDLEVPAKAQTEKLSPFERAKHWFNGINSDIRTYGGLNYFANKWNRPNDWLMSREGGRNKARVNVLLGVTAIAVASAGGKLLEGTTGFNPFALVPDTDFSFAHGSGHNASPTVSSYFEAAADTAVVDGGNQFEIPQTPEAPASIPVEATLDNPAFTINNGQTGYELFDTLGLSHTVWDEHAGDLLKFPDFYMEDGDIRLAHEGVLSEEARQYLLDLTHEAKS